MEKGFQFCMKDGAEFKIIFKIQKLVKKEVYMQKPSGRRALYEEILRGGV